MEDNRGSSPSSASTENGSLHPPPPPPHPPPPPPPPPPPSTLPISKQTSSQAQPTPNRPRTSPRPSNTQEPTSMTTASTATYNDNTNNLHPNITNETSTTNNNGNDSNTNTNVQFENLPIISVRVLSSSTNHNLEKRAARETTTFSPPKKRQRIKMLWNAIYQSSSNSQMEEEEQEEEEQEEEEENVVRILVTPNLTEQQLESCILQAAAASYPCHSKNNHLDEEGESIYQSKNVGIRRRRSKKRSLSSSSSTTTTTTLPPPQKLAGMFRESDNIFIPLSYILSSPQSFQGQVFCLKHEATTPAAQQEILSENDVVDTTTQRNSLNRRRRTEGNQYSTKFMISSGVVIGFISIFWAYRVHFIPDDNNNDDDYYYNHRTTTTTTTILDKIQYSLETFDLYHALFIAREIMDGFIVWMMTFFVKVLDVLIEMPLRELYRHGPAIIGWEGASLPQICARITYHGDEEFWSKNWQECEKIYLLKEEAALRIRKPILYAILAYVLFLAVRSLVRSWALRRRGSPDANMIETFTAFNALVRQLKRAYVED